MNHMNSNPRFQAVTYELIGSMRAQRFTLDEAEIYLEHVSDHVKGSLKHMDFFPRDTVLDFLRFRYPAFMDQAAHSLEPVELPETSPYLYAEYAVWAGASAIFRPVSRNVFYERLLMANLMARTSSDLDRPQKGSGPSEPC